MGMTRMLVGLAVAGATMLGTMQVQAGALGSAFKINDGAVSGERSVVDTAAAFNGDQVVMLRNFSNESRWTAHYRSDGSLIGGAFGAVGNSGDAIATDRAGNKAVVGLISGTPGVYARVYDRSGALITPQFRVDGGAAGTLGYPLVGMNADGLIAVTWSNFQSSTGSKSVHYRMFNRNGTARTGVLTVATLQNPILEANSVVVDRLGNASVAYIQRDFSTPIGINVWLRRYTSTGAAIGSTQRVSDASEQSLLPRIAINPDGQMVITWSQFASGASSRRIMAQRFNASATRLGGNVLISDTAGNGQNNEVAMMDDGSYTVVWDNDNTQAVPASVPGVFARQYRSDGTAVASEFRVSDTAIGGYQGRLSMDLAGNFLVVWSQYDTASAKWNVYGRRYVMDTLPQVTTLQNGVAATGLSGALGSSRFFKIAIPPGISSFVVTMTGNGDADLVIRYAALPSQSTYDIYPGLNGSNESVQVSTPPDGDFYIEVYGYQAYSNVSLQVTY